MKTFTRILSILMVVMMLSTISLTALASATAEVRKVVSQPTSKNPTFVLSDTQDVTYSWYELTYDDTVLTDESEGVAAMDGAVYADGVWTPFFDSYNAICSFFEIELQGGESVIIEHGNGAYPGDYTLEAEVNGSYHFEALDSKRSIVEIPVSGKYTLISSYVVYDTPIKAYIRNGATSEQLTGQNTATLTEYEIGKAYFANAKYGDGEEFTSEIFLMTYAIVGEPKQSNPTILTNADGDVSKYKWYFLPVGEQYTVSVSENYMYVVVYVGAYENGLWSGEYTNISIDGIDGDVIYVEPVGEFEGSVCLYSDDSTVFELGEDGRYSYELNEDNYYFADFEVNSYDANASVKIYLQRGDKRIDIADSSRSSFNEDNMTFFADYVSSGYYDSDRWVGTDGEIVINVENDRDDVAIEVSVADGLDVAVYDNDAGEEIVEEDGVFPIDEGNYIIVVYSEDKDPEAELSIIDGDKKYEIIQEYDSIFDEEKKLLYVDTINNGRYEDGVWYSNGESNDIDLEFDLQKGDVLTVIASDEYEGEVIIDVSNAGGYNIVLEQVDGKYVFVADRYYEFDLELEENPVEFSAIITVERSSIIELKDSNSNRLNVSERGYYYADVTFKDGTTLRTALIDICDHSANQNVIHCDKNGECSACGTEIEALGHSFGEWTETKLATNNENGLQTRACIRCGKTEAREIEKLGGAGVEVIFIIIGSALVLGGASVSATYFILKRKSQL